MKPEDSQTQHELIDNLRRALHYLYDPIELRKSPLLGLFGLSSSAGAPALRQTLEEAIAALKPTGAVSPQADSWRIYRTLYHRYIEQFSQTSVSANLGLSVRQLRRQERMALQALADWLIQRHHLNISATATPMQGEGEVDPLDIDDDVHEMTATAEKLQSTDLSVKQELKWIEQSFPSSEVAISWVVLSTLQTVKPLLEASAVECQSELPENLPNLRVQAVTVRHILLNLLTAAIQAVPEGRVRISAGYIHPHVWVDIQPSMWATTTAAKQLEPDGESVRIARELAALSGGSLEVAASRPGIPFRARLLLPAIEQNVVLVIDDNQDALQLVQRYLVGSRYVFIGTHDPTRMERLVQEYRPRAILLDVMLPSIDGWELLGRLRENPETSVIPVIICTILPQEELALKLGAAAFLRKPINRERLIQVLDQQTNAPGVTAPG